MENTTFSTKTWAEPPKLTRQQLCRGCLFEHPAVRPPILDEMMPDLERVIHSMAQQYSDSSTPHLAFEDMVGEGRLKLAELITKGELDRQLSRLNFFKFFATAVNNMARSRVQKYRFTEKRTGQKPPPKHERFKTQRKDDEVEHDPETSSVNEYRKNVDLSLDDPDAGLQVASTMDEQEQEMAHLEEEFESLLNPVEVLVFRQLHRPNASARQYAFLDAHRKAASVSLHVRIRNEHLAAGIGLDLEVFEKAVLSVRQKIMEHRMKTDDQLEVDAKVRATVSTLAQIFGLQIAPNTDDIVIRRMFTLAARDQYDEKVKGNPEIAEMLALVGAKSPQVVGHVMTCYGILYQRNNRRCNSCDLRHACAVEAANLGLDKIQISPQLLGKKGVQSPVFLPKSGSLDSRVTTVEHAEVIAHLDEFFDKEERDNSVAYFHNTAEKQKRRVLFSVAKDNPGQVRFCNPSDDLKKRLSLQQKSWYPKPHASMPEIIELIEQHAKETFE